MEPCNLGEEGHCRRKQDRPTGEAEEGRAVSFGLHPHPHRPPFCMDTRQHCSSGCHVSPPILQMEKLRLRR
jgi:hypothetical protein